MLTQNALQMAALTRRHGLPFDGKRSEVAHSFVMRVSMTVVVVAVDT
jgi:hypothetical protein